jgi:circadian clock protein KaiC
MGEPGSGKTILAEELNLRQRATGGDDEQRPILYLTTLSEPLDKVIKYLQQFHFFDAAKIGTAIVYERSAPNWWRRVPPHCSPRSRTSTRSAGR